MVSLVERDVFVDDVKVDEFPRGDATTRTLDGLSASLRQRRGEEPSREVVLADRGPYTLRVGPETSMDVARSILVTAANAGHYRVRIEGWKQPASLHMPIRQPPTDTDEPTREWLIVRLGEAESTIEWVRKAPDPATVEVIATSSTSGEDVAGEVAKTFVSWGDAAPCDDIAFLTDRSERFGRVVEVLTALKDARECPREPWIGLAFRSPDPHAQPLYPPAARASIGAQLPPEEIQRVVRTQYDVFRECYEAGLARNPKLEGRVVVRFVIDRDGSVSKTELTESSLPDEEAVACIVEGYGTLAFPKPKGGIVTVVYPIMFSSE